MTPKKRFIVTQTVEFTYTVEAEDDEMAIDKIQNLDWKDADDYEVVEEVSEEYDNSDEDYERAKDAELEEK
jgi:hypothetical protein